jgi:hypothetical protein
MADALQTFWQDTGVGRLLNPRLEQRSEHADGIGVVLGRKKTID